MHHYIHCVSILSRRKPASRGGSTLRSISSGKWCPHGHTSPTVKHTPAKERKVHNSGGPYPCSDLCISRSLHQGRKPGLDMRFNVHNGEGPHPHPDVVSPAFLEALTSRNRTFRHPNWPKTTCVNY